jgi:hypothetical protein
MSVEHLLGSRGGPRVNLMPAFGPLTWAVLVFFAVASIRQALLTDPAMGDRRPEGDVSDEKSDCHT